MRFVPVDFSPSWPRTIANAINALITQVTTMTPFFPSADTVSVTIAATSASATIGNPDQVRLQNASTETVFCKLGASGVAATLAAGFPIPSGGVEVFSIPANLAGAPVYVAAIGTGSTGKLYCTPGVGL